MKKFILGLFFCLSVFGQAILVNHSTATASPAGSGSAVVTLDTTGSTLLIGCYAAWGGGMPASPITDSYSNLWYRAGSAGGGDAKGQLWYSFPTSSKVGASHQITAGGGNGNILAVMAFKNVASGPDQTSTKSFLASPTTIPAVTPLNDNELVASCAGTAFGTAMSVASPMVLVDTVPFNGGYNGYEGIGSAYQVQTTAAAIGPVWSGAPDGGGITATFYSTLSPAALSVVSTSVPEGFNGSAYSYQLTASGGVRPYTWTIASGSLPTGLTLRSDGLISGTPTQTVLDTPLTFTVTDSASVATTTGNFPLTIAASSLSITTSTCPSGSQYQTYAGCSMVAAGGTSPYTWSVYLPRDTLSSSLPEGLTVDPSTGSISGTVYGQGRYSTKLLATDARGGTVQKAIIFDVAGDNSLGGCSLFPNNSIFHTNISGLPVDLSPAAQIPAVYQSGHIRVFFGSNGGGNGYTPNGIPFLRVPWDQPLNNIVVSTGEHYQQDFTQAPIPLYAPIEASDGSGLTVDRHVSIIQTAGNGNPCRLWEMWISVPFSNYWQEASTAYWPDIGSNTMRPNGRGSTDAAGLPIAPMLLRYEEVASDSVNHPVRFTLQHILNYWVWPARQTAGTGTCKKNGVTIGTYSEISQLNPPDSCTMSAPAGEIYRLKAGTRIPACDGHPQATAILHGFFNFGIIVSDNGMTGGLIGTPDSRWDNTDLACLTTVLLSYFEPVDVSSLRVSADSYEAASTALTILTSSLPPGIIGSAYNQALRAQGGTAPYVWNLVSGAMCSGLTFGASSISGTPTGTESCSFTIRVTDSTGTAVSQFLSMTTGVMPVAPTVTTFSLPAAVIGIPYSQTVAATGDLPITWTVQSGSLPVWATLNPATGVIYGNPSVAATSSFTLRATNATGHADQSLSISAAFPPPKTRISGLKMGGITIK